MSSLTRRETLTGRERLNGESNGASWPLQPLQNVLQNPAVQSLLAGGTAGIVSRTAVAPIERVKILLQVQSLSARGHTPRHTSVVGSLHSIVKTEGVGGLWRGNSANCVRVFPSSALQFYCYPQWKLALFGEREDLTPLERLSAGALAGAVAQTVTYPLDFIRARLTVDMRSRYSGGVWSAMYTVVRTEGPLALYRGIVPSLVGIMPYVGIDFAVYDVLRDMLPRRAPGSDEPTVLGKLAAGGVAGACAQTVAYPLDTVRRILQVQDTVHAVQTAPRSEAYTGMLDCLVRLVRRDGVLALYSGLGANYLKVVPSVGVSFVVFEATKQWFKEVFPPPAKRP